MGKSAICLYLLKGLCSITKIVVIQLSSNYRTVLTEISLRLISCPRSRYKLEYVIQIGIGSLETVYGLDKKSLS